jgi:ribose transport system permease protein
VNDRDLSHVEEELPEGPMVTGRGGRGSVSSPEFEKSGGQLATSPSLAGGRLQSAAATVGLSRLLERFGALGILLLAIGVFSVLRPDTFPTAVNAEAILVSQGVLALLVLGLLLPLAAGEFDLSIGFVMSFCTAVVGALTAFQGWNPLAASLFTFALALAVGAANGLLIVYARINSFIATLGMGTVLAGLTNWISKGQIIGAASVQVGGAEKGLPGQLLWLGQTDVLGIGLPVIWMLIAVVVFAVVMGHTQFGRFLYAVGGGREVARLAGVPTNRLVVLAFMVSAATSCFAAFVALGLFGSAHPDVGDQYLLPAFAAAFLGATAIQPGRFNVWGSIVAIFLLAVLVTGLQQLGAPYWVSSVFNGLALIVAVGLARSREWRS